MQIITALAEKSASGDYIYRGESKCFDKVSSRLYREYPSASDIDSVQDAELEEAKRYTLETDDFTILTELQHYGGRTNLIDFTADYLIALFFACDGNYPHDGRVILLERTEEREEEIYGPRYPANRVLAQKSIFVRPKSGYIEPDAAVVIPFSLKLPMLEYLERGHGIQTATIYNDLHGFIRRQTIHREANENFAMGLGCQRNGDYLDAIECYNKALNLNPRMTTAYFNRGICYSAAGELDQAITDYSRAIELTPEDADAYFQRGYAYGELGEYELAIQDCTKAIELNPENADAYFCRGYAHSNQGNYGLAIQDFSQSIDLDPEDADTYFQRGFIYNKQGDYASAIRAYTKVIELDPDDRYAYYSRGEIQLHLAQWELARSDLTVASDMELDVVDLFLNDYEDVTAFEAKTGLKVPEDIAEMLGG